jgi:hypothetical protein
MTADALPRPEFERAEVALRRAKALANDPNWADDPDWQGFVGNPVFAPLFELIEIWVEKAE